MKKSILIIFSLVVALTFTSCDDFLDRTPLTTSEDGVYWTSENNVRLFTNGFYNNYFNGYSSGWGVDYAPLRGYNFSDDVTRAAKQTGFETTEPTSREDLREIAPWLTTYAGPTWCFAWVRKSNLLLERVEKMKQENILTDEQYKHWSAVGRFFRAYEYSRLVSVFGNVPYFDKVLIDDEIALMYKDRDSRTFVMDKVYDDFKYVMDNNMRTSDGEAQILNKYIAAGFISRFMLFEGTWQKYHLNNAEKAKKYLEFAVEAADFVMTSGKYNFSSDFRSLFGSQDLSGNKEVILYRHYEASQGVYHHVASYSNLTETQSPASNLDLAKSFICNDGQPYLLSTVPNATQLDITSMIANRDPRFEATFWGKPVKESSTLLYACKFIDREGVTYYGKTYPSRYRSSTNTNDAPVIRLAEVVLSWVEAKAELAGMGGTPVSQADLDASINAIRNRPLDTDAIDKGIQKTALLQIGAIPDDPERDSDVPALLWEIRRERRMEFVFEHTRLMDIKRWKKIDYMDFSKYPDKMLGLWIDFQAEYPSWLIKGKEGKLKVMKADKVTVVTYNGTNAADMIGYYIPEGFSNRDAFTDRVYLAPVGGTQISQYKDKGYTLTQTPGW